MFLFQPAIEVILPTKRILDRDSLKQITKKTRVVNYNNDAETRKFFVKQIGHKFKFNAYLRQFTNKKKISN